MAVYNYQTPQTNIPAAFQSLAASNSAMAQRQIEADAIARQRAQDSAAGTGALAGAALAATAVAAAAPTGGASLSLLVGAAGVGASAGSQIGRASAGGKVDQAAVLQTGLQAASVANQAQQTSSEQNTISGLQASRAAMAAKDAATPYSSVDTAGDTPPKPVDPMAASVDKALAGAKDSVNPFQTANNALALIRAAVPSSAPEQITVGGTTALVQRDAVGMLHKIVENTAGGPGAPQQIWVNKNYANPQAEPDWQPKTLASKDSLTPIINQVGEGNVLLQDPNRGQADHQTFQERALTELAGYADDRDNNRPLTKTKQRRENFLWQAVGKPSVVQTERGPVTMPGIGREEWENAREEQKTSQAGSAPSSTQSTTPPLPLPDRNALRQDIIPAAEQAKVESRAKAKENINVLRQNLDQTGAFGGGLVNSLLGSAGLNNAAVEFDANAKKLELSVVGGMSTQVVNSDMERETLRGTLPKITDAPEVAKVKMDVLEKAMSIDEKLQYDWLKDNKYVISKQLRDAAEKAGERLAGSTSNFSVGSEKNPYYAADRKEALQLAAEGKIRPGDYIVIAGQRGRWKPQKKAN